MPLLATDLGSSALIDFTSDTFNFVSLAAPLESAPTVTDPAEAPWVRVAASLSPPHAASPAAREATAAVAVTPRRTLLFEGRVRMTVLVGWVR